MKLIIGLGNPGKKYEQTRHNAGYLALDYWQKQLGWPPFKEEKKNNALTTTGQIGRKKIILAKPLTYMNDSGQSARALLDFYKLKPEQITVIHDDKDIAVGKIKIQNSRGAAGHNGVKSLIAHLGGKNFTRLRIGTAPANPAIANNADSFVLGDFTADEQKILTPVWERIIEELKKILTTDD